MSRTRIALLPLVVFAIGALAACSSPNRHADPSAVANCIEQTTVELRNSGQEQREANLEARSFCNSTKADAAFDESWADGNFVPIELTVDTPDGARDNPFAIGDVIVLSEYGLEKWQVSLGSPTIPADEIVAAENQFNKPAPAGFVYALVPLTVRNLGTEPSDPWFEFHVAFVAATGETYDDVFGVIPMGFDDIGDLYQGGTGVGNFLIAVPAHYSDGTWRVTKKNNDLDFFFSAI